MIIGGPWWSYDACSQLSQNASSSFKKNKPSRTSGFDARLSIRCVHGRIASQAKTPRSAKTCVPTDIPSLLAHRDGGSRRAEAGTATFTESPFSLVGVSRKNRKL